ncbi:MAG: carboxypeptidase-like regulatory domain-containing protein [Bacteroidaceae bacterium]|nr:carboxypeptidase-like regulatory domain-containing protein [Bacteroidaceae bacterium]
MRKSKRKTMGRVVSALLWLLLFPIGAWAQGMAVRGVVNDETGEPVIGASVSVKGTTNGTITDYDGRFVLSGVERGATIVVAARLPAAKSLSAVSRSLNTK